MGLVFGTLFDPGFQELDLFGRKRLLRFRRWHDFGSVVRVDSRNQVTLGERAGSDGLQIDCWLALIESQIGLAIPAIWAVACEAVVREDWSNIAVVIEFGRRIFALGLRDGEGGLKCDEGQAE
jgi:hypothetical protein